MNIKPIVRGEKDIMCDALKSACNKREITVFLQSLHAYVVCEESFNVKEKRAGCYCGEKSHYFNITDELPLFILRHFEPVLMFFCELQKEMSVRMLKLPLAYIERRLLYGQPT